MSSPRRKAKGPPRIRSRRVGRWALLAVLLSLAVVFWGSEGQRPMQTLAENPSAVPRLKVRVLEEYPHDPSAYTQGLLWVGDGLIESTGLHGLSTLRRVDLPTGRVIDRLKLDSALFGEGLARVGDRLFQLTWQAQLGLIYDLETLKPEGQFFYKGEGWGLCFDGESLVMSDGSDTLSFRDPETFAEKGRRKVTFEGRPLHRLNELECVGEEIYANVYTTEAIARIDSSTGRVTAMIDASGLLTPEERRKVEVLNGIAYDSQRGVFLITGKLWPKVFEVTFVETSKMGT